MIYLWRNNQEKRLKMGSKLALKEDFFCAQKGTIDVLISLRAHERHLANRIIRQFNEEIHYPLQSVAS